MIEQMHSGQLTLEREMKRRRVPLWGAGYPLTELEDVIRVDTEPTALAGKEVDRREFRREPATTRWRATLNLIRLSFE